MEFNKSILKELDGFRVLAVLLVVSFHISFYFDALPGYNTIIGTGYLGVQLFFLLSSFLLARQFLTTYSIGTNTKEYILTFFKKRVCRIYPLFIFSSIILYLIGYKHIELTFGTVIKYFFFIEDIHLNPVIWSLFVEMRFYLVLPVLMHSICLLITRNKIREVYILLFVLAGISYGYRFYHLYYYGIEKGEDFLYESFWANIDCLALGIAGAVIYERSKYLIINRTTLYFIFTVSGCILFYAMNIKYYKLYNHAFIPQMVFSICNIAWMLAILSLLFLRQGKLNRVFSLNIFVYLSTISYGIYIWHLPIRDYIYDLCHALTLKGILGILVAPLTTWTVTILISMICYKCLEKPLLYKRKTIVKI
ncbi:acyltransferase [Flavobacterium sp.]|uniref:acyltransferase family protein n=1 Tax=Flavobacterium sp. TaxID=239 RepID=UPI0025C314DB|nr:acyltransferase [Flavobacterium sp.]